jgi:acyl carrier protein
MIDRVEIEEFVATKIGLPVEVLQTDLELDFEYHYGIPPIMLLDLTKAIENKFNVKIVNSKKLSLNSPERPTKKNPAVYIPVEDQAVRTIRQIFDAIGV